jgi:hypothetical protein
LVVEVARRATWLEVVLVHVDAVPELRHQLSHPAYLALQQADRVLALDGVVEHGRVERPAILLGDDARLVDDSPHGLEYPLGAV